MSCRKCIGVMLSQPRSDYQQQLLKGIYKRAFELDMNVAVFCTYTKEGCFKDNPVCESQIFKLPNEERLYGMIYVPDTIQFSNSEWITEQLREWKHCPVVSVDVELDGFPCLITGEDKIIGSMVEHLHKVHGCTDIAYMTGIKGHPHAEGRLDGYRKKMAELGLAVSEDRVYYGDFWYDEGENFVRQLINSEKGLPQAIACASNRMAHSVYHALLKRNINVPGDVMITGHYEMGDKFQYITASGKDACSTGIESVDMLCRIKDGKAAANENYRFECEPLLNYSYTCGCEDNTIKLSSEDDVNAYLEEDHGYFSVYNNLKEELLEASNYREFFWTVDWYTYYLGEFKHFSICLNDGWDDIMNDIDGVEQTEYTQKMQMVYCCNSKPDGERDKWVNFGNCFDREVMHPALWEDNEKPQAFYFVPMFSRKQCYGYALLSYGEANSVPDVAYRFWLKDILTAFEAQRRMNNIRSLYSEMQKNAVTDMMTGLYNRNGFNMFIGDVVEGAVEKSSMIAVVMADLNCLKYINDVYGHAEGDNAIKTAAAAMLSESIRACDKLMTFRMGGDEYLTVAVGSFTSNDVENYKKSVLRYLEKYNSDSGKEYPVIISLGSCVSEAKDISSIDSMITAADVIMLNNKADVKKLTGFDHRRK